MNVLEKPKPIKEMISQDPEYSIYPDNEGDGVMINNQLKEELNMADELIEYYESDDYKRHIRASLIDSNL